MKKHYVAFFIVMVGIVFILVNISVLCAEDGKATAGTSYLVISEFKDVYYSLSPNEREELIAANNVKFDAAVKAGNILKVYRVPGWNRTVTIEKYNSVGDLYKHFEEAPVYPYVDFEVYPLFESEMDADIAAKAKPDPKKMKFLVMNEAKDVYYTLPADERKKIDEESPFQPGDLLEMYSIPGWNRYAAIEQYDSIESLYQHFANDSYNPYGNFEVYPLFEEDLSQ